MRKASKWLIAFLIDSAKRSTSTAPSSSAVPPVMQIGMVGLSNEETIRLLWAGDTGNNSVSVVFSEFISKVIHSSCYQQSHSHA